MPDAPYRYESKDVRKAAEGRKATQVDVYVCVFSAHCVVCIPVFEYSYILHAHLLNIYIWHRLIMREMAMPKGKFFGHSMLHTIQITHTMHAYEL